MTTTASQEVSATSTDDRDTPRWLARLTGAPGRVMLALISGVLLQLSFPPRTLWFLAPLAFAGLGLAVYRRRARAGFGYGLVFAVAFFLLHLMWIEDFLGAGFGSAPWLALSALQGIFVALACAGMAVVQRLPAAPLWMSALWVGQETLRASFPLNGFPWGRAAFSQPSGVFTSLASIGGAPLVSLAVTLCGFGLAWVLVGVARRTVRLVPAVAFAVVPVLAGLAVWPTIGVDPTRGELTVAIVQGNAPNIGLDLLSAREEIRANHFATSERLLADIDAGRVARPDLLVWPETATAVGDGDRQLDRLVGRFGVPALIGALYLREDGLTENAVFAWDPDDGRGEHYAKQELVPFAEYVPWRSIAAWFTPFLDNTTDMRPGDRPGLLSPGGVPVGVLICYEAAYDYVARETVDGGAELLVVPTNNAWYGPG
ncbi:MAG: apolipoprotein N-acyltransferase, partial [Thermocrispum sp.]